MCVCLNIANEHQQKGKIHTQTYNHTIIHRYIQNRQVLSARSREMHSIANRYKIQKENTKNEREGGKREKDTQMRFQMFFSSFQLPFACSIH